MAVQYRDQEALYLLSLMYSQGWGVPASPELSSLMMERLNGSSYSTDSLNPNAPIAAYWLPLPLAGEKNTILRFTIPGPFAPSQLKGVTLHNTSLKDAFSISKINILQHGRLILDIISPQEVLPGQKLRSHRHIPSRKAAVGYDPASGSGNFADPRKQLRRGGNAPSGGKEKLRN